MKSFEATSPATATARVWRHGNVTVIDDKGVMNDLWWEKLKRASRRWRVPMAEIFKLAKRAAEAEVEAEHRLSAQLSELEPEDLEGMSFAEQAELFLAAVDWIEFWAEHHPNPEIREALHQERAGVCEAELAQMLEKLEAHALRSYGVDLQSLRRGRQ